MVFRFLDPNIFQETLNNFNILINKVESNKFIKKNKPGFVEFCNIPIAPWHEHIYKVVNIKNILKSITDVLGIRNVTDYLISIEIYNPYAF